MGNVLIAIQLLTALMDRAGAIGALIKNAVSEGRDISTAELDQLARDDDAARTNLEAAIAKARAEGR
jgi:hypothetical protein